MCGSGTAKRLSTSRDDETLTEVVGKTSAEACAAGLNYLAQVYHDGTRVTYPLYSEEEIAAVPARAHAELYYCPAQQPGARFAIVLSGNALYYSGELRGGVSTAWELHEQGYAVFSLRYRIGWEAGDDAPLEDLARAIRFVMDNADTFGVSTEDYALLGYSSGGQLAGVFGNEEKGWGRYGVPKPGVLLLAYPINNFFGAKPAYHLLMDTDRLERRYYSYTVSKLVTPDYPPTFLWYGRNDPMLKAFVYPLQGPTPCKGTGSQRRPQPGGSLRQRQTWHRHRRGDGRRGLGGTCCRVLAERLGITGGKDYVRLEWINPQPECGPARRHRPAESGRILSGGYRPHRPAAGRGLDKDPERPGVQRHRPAGGVCPA